MSAPNPPALATTVFLARHGQSEWNHQGRITGQTDIALSERGHEQSRGIALCLQPEPIAAIYTSALRRTQDTARPTAEAKGLPLQALAGLNEIHLGDLQGRFRDERDPEAQAVWAAWQADLWGFRVPGGERFDEFATRVLQAFEGIVARHAGERVLIVGHRQTNRVLLGHLFGWPRERWAELRLRNKFLYRLQPGTPPAVATYTLSGSKTGRCQDGFEM